MIDFDEKDIVAVHRTADDRRFVLFTSTDVRPYWGQRFWGVVLDTGGDGFSTLVRYGTGSTAPSGWTVRELLHVAQARMVAEHARAPDAGVLAALEALGDAVRLMPQGEMVGNDISFGSDGRKAPYSWTVARCGDLHLPLCPDPESWQEGIAPEQLLIVTDQALKEWSERAPYLRCLWNCRTAIRDALAAEVRRVRILRGSAGSNRPA